MQEKCPYFLNDIMPVLMKSEIPNTKTVEFMPVKSIKSAYKYQ